MIPRIARGAVVVTPLGEAGRPLPDRSPRTPGGMPRALRSTVIQAGSSLEAFQHEHFPQRVWVALWNAPLLIVIGLHQGVIACPRNVRGAGGDLS